MSSFHGQTSKSSRTIVKPILRKFTQSEKNSLDLDRPSEYHDAFGVYEYGTGFRSTHDVAFNPGRRAYHNRSTSGTSTATAGSTRGGSFVHPFAQTPRPFTPPLTTANSYQNSLRESEHSDSPIVTEDEEQRPTFRSTSNLSNRSPSLTSNTSPNIGSQPLRIQTKLSSSSRLALATSHTSISNSSLASPDITSPADSMGPASAMRTSIEKGGIRLRSHSEATKGRSETIEEARRKFHQREQAKDEKFAKEEVRALEKKNQKEARMVERGHRRSSASEGGRNKPPTKSDPTMQEKGFFVGGEYGSVPGQPPPNIEEEAGDGHNGTRKSYTGFSGTKHKTHSTWTKFVMWLRTRFLRMSSPKTKTKTKKQSGKKA